MSFVNSAYFLRTVIFITFLLHISSSFTGIKDLSYSFNNIYNNMQSQCTILPIAKPFFNKKNTSSTKIRKLRFAYPFNQLMGKNYHTTKQDSQSVSIVKYTADDVIVLDALQEIFSLHGSSTIEDDNIKLMANHISFNAKTQTIYAEGTKNKYHQPVGEPILIYQDKQQDKYGQDANTTTRTFFIEKLKYNIHTKRGLAHKLITKQEESIIKTAKVKKDDEITFQAQDVIFTTCNLENPHFYIKTKKAKIVQDQYIISGPFYFCFDHVPTPLGFYSGTLFLEGKKKHGILPPEIGEDSNGFYLRNGGYYISFNDYVDLAMLGTIFSSGLAEFQSKLRYKKRYLCAGNIEYVYNTASKTNNWSIRWQHKTLSNPIRSLNSNIFIMNNAFQRVGLDTRKANKEIENISSGLLTYCDQLQLIPYSLNIKTTYQKNHHSNFTHWTLPEGTLMAIYYPFRQNSATIKKTWLNNMQLKHTIQFENHFKNQKYDSGKYYINKNSKNNPWNNYTENGILQTLPLSIDLTLLNFKLTPNFTYSEAWYWKKRAFNHKWEPTYITGFNRVYSYHMGGKITTTLYHTQYFNNPTIQGLRIKMEPSATLTYTPDFSTPEYGFYQEVPNAKGEKEKVYLFQGFVPSKTINSKSSIIEYNLHNSIELKVDNNQVLDKKKTKTHKIYLLKYLDFSTKYDFKAKEFKFVDGINMHIATSINKIAKCIDMDLDLTTNFEPYLLRINHLGHQIQEERINILAWHYGKFLGKVRDLILHITINFTPKTESNMDPISQLYQDTNDNNGYLNDTQERFPLHADTLWNFGLKLQYALYRKKQRAFNEPKYDKTKFITLNGSIKLTEKWQIYGKTTYNFKEKKLDPFTEISIQRDLHCWQLSFMWNPIGEKPYYDLSLRAKANILKALNLPRKRSYNKLK